MASSVQVRIDRAGLRRLLSQPGGPGDRLLRQVTERAAMNARRLAPGSMGSQIRTEYRQESGGAVGFVVSEHPASAFVVFGTRPHLIRPRRARALRWVGASGRPVFAKLVRHPGTRANDFLLEGLRQAL